MGPVRKWPVCVLNLNRKKLRFWDKVELLMLKFYPPYIICLHFSLACKMHQGVHESTPSAIRSSRWWFRRGLPVLHTDYSTINLTKIRLKLRDFEFKVLNLRGCSPLRQQWDTSKSPLQACNLTWKHYRYTLRHSNAQTAIFLEKTSLLCTISSQTDLTFTQQTNFHNISI